MELGENTCNWMDQKGRRKKWRKRCWREIDHQRFDAQDHEQWKLGCNNWLTFTGLQKK